ncbi:MAG: hypothetical protein JOS17DRAFT_302991, partial [Linnemannia elongata]
PEKKSRSLVPRGYGSFFPLLESASHGFLDVLELPLPAKDSLSFPLPDALLVPFTISSFCDRPSFLFLFPFTFSTLAHSFSFFPSLPSLTHSPSSLNHSNTPLPFLLSQLKSKTTNHTQLALKVQSPMDTSRNSQVKPTKLPSSEGSEALLGPTRRDARSVLHHPYEALSKAHHHQHHNHYRHHHHYLRHESYLHPTSNSSEVWTLPPSPHSSASTSASSLARTAEWLRWLIHSAAVSSLEAVPNDSTRQLMLLDLSVDGSCTGSHSRSDFDRMPGIRHYNQGTEETTGRPMSSAATTPRPSQGSTAKNHNNANANNNSGASNNNNSNAKNTNTRSSATTGQSTTTPHQQSGSHPYPLTPSSWSSQPPTPPSPPSSFSRSTVNSATIAAAARNARNRGDSDDKSASTSSPSSGRRGSSASSTGSTVGAGTPTSALLFSTSQEFHQVWSQTTAFLHRTFSPTYRVSHLYWDSWTNGTQRRGLERLKTSVLRGDAFRLMQNTTVQLRNLWNRSIAESRAQASEIERQAKAFEEKTRQIKQRAFGKSSSSTTSPSSGSSKENKNSNSSSSSGNKTEEGGQENPRK